MNGRGVLTWYTSTTHTEPFKHIFSVTSLLPFISLCEHEFQRAAAENTSLYLAPNRRSPHLHEKI